MALFGKTAKEWRIDNPELEGNIRDFASINELICLANLENLMSITIMDTFVKMRNYINIRYLKYFFT